MHASIFIQKHLPYSFEVALPGNAHDTSNLDDLRSSMSRTDWNLENKIGLRRFKRAEIAALEEGGVTMRRHCVHTTQTRYTDLTAGAPEFGYSDQFEVFLYQVH